MKRRTGSGSLFWAVTIFLLLVTAYFCAGTVMSRTDLSARELENYYQEQERELVDRVREFLEGEGLGGSGVMLTRVMTEDGGRQYTIIAHHRKIDKMSQADRGLLLEALEQISFPDENCVFFYKFLLDQ